MVTLVPSLITSQSRGRCAAKTVKSRANNNLLIYRAQNTQPPVHRLESNKDTAVKIAQIHWLIKANHSPEHNLMIYDQALCANCDHPLLAAPFIRYYISF